MEKNSNKNSSVPLNKTQEIKPYVSQEDITRYEKKMDELKADIMGVLDTIVEAVTDVSSSSSSSDEEDGIIEPASQYYPDSDEEESFKYGSKPKRQKTEKKTEYYGRNYRSKWNKNQ